MKKVLFFAVACMATFAFSSCKQKSCTCTEVNSGISQTIETNEAYPTCADIQALYASEVKAQGITNQNWKCK